MTNLKLQTLLAQGTKFYKNSDTDAELYHGMAPPIIPSASFYHKNEKTSDSKWLYARFDTPAVQQTESHLAELEQGETALLFSSGMAALSAFFMSFEPGATIFVQKQTYFVTREWLDKYAKKLQLTVRLVDIYNLDELDLLCEAMQPKAIWIETPYNPEWGIVDIAQISEICKKHNAYLAVDSTAATPVLTQPITYGADFVIHSASKVLNGHSDVVAGCIVVKEKDELWEQLYLNRRLNGSILGAFESWLFLRGLRTLYIRVKQSSETALKVAKWLSDQPLVENVFYAGLEGHPQHEIAKKQMSGLFGGMISFTVKADSETCNQMTMKTNLFNRATSYGEIDSRIELRNQIQDDIPSNLIRLSIGLEDPEDLIQDLSNAFD